MHNIKRGLNLPITGEPEQKIDAGPKPGTVAILADDYLGMRPRMLVQVGDKIKRGQKLFEDRKNPGVFVTAPGTGTLSAINRGARRALRSVVVKLKEGGAKGSEEVQYESYSGKNPTSLSSDEVRAALIESGLWTALRTRPFSKVPAVDTAPRSIFVTAHDTNPLAPDAQVILAEQQADFEAGLSVLSKLANGGKVYLCKGAGSSVSAGSAGQVETHEFSGPHPAGTAGLHIHLIDPADMGRVVWHIGYQDTAAVGHFFKTGKLSVERVVALSGPQVNRPRLIRTRLGAPIAGLTNGELKAGENRILSGSVLNGRAAVGDEEGYLGRYHNQVTVLKEGNERHFLGWLAPGFNKFSMLRMFASKLIPGKKFDFDTDLNGGPRGIVPVGSYEKVMAFDLMPTFLLRSVVANDMEKAEELGVLELDEEDVALCTFVCPSKNEYGVALREMLTRIEKEG
ncbi:MAG: Na(+)-translocating NADH-quinone reductase subunit A [Proteobacteria bacterium]|nr:Na(+)-translocating NADH-quinone reductase subunit A [Pseudomonadota bacterium]